MREQTHGDERTGVRAQAQGVAALARRGLEHGARERHQGEGECRAPVVVVVDGVPAYFREDFLENVRGVPQGLEVRF